MPMPNDAGRTRSIWMETADVPTYPPLDRDVTTDVCVVGAGIAGLSVAYHLLKAGRRVVVLDDGAVAGGESGRTTGHLNSYIDDGLSDTESRHGEGGLRLAVESHAAAVDAIERACRDEGIDADFLRRDEVVFVAPDAADGQAYLDKEMDAARRIGLAGARFEPRAPIPGVDTGRCLMIPNQAQFHAGKYFDGLARAIARLGGEVYGGTHAAQIEGGDAAHVVTADGRAVRCDHVVIATCSPSGGVFRDLLQVHIRQAAYRTFVVGLRVRPGDVTPALYSDTLEPYHYARVQAVGDDEEILIVGGEDHKTGEADDADERFARLESWARAHWPAAGAVAYRWSGQVYEPDDYLARIGPNPGDQPNVYIATGDSGMGLTHGTIAGFLLTDLILGRDNPYAKLYDPARLAPSGVADFVKENADAAWQYTDLLTPGEVSSADDLAPGDGATVRRGLTKVACYRDPSGGLHEHTAICPHLGGVLRFNTAECSWDCPIHGSRFKAVGGEVIDGPANTNLAGPDEPNLAG